MGMGAVPDSVAYSGIPFPPIGLPVYSSFYWIIGVYLVLLKLVMPCLTNVPGRSVVL